MTLRFLDLADVLEIHESRILPYGGTPSIRDLGLLQSAIAQPLAQVAGEFLLVRNGRCLSVSPFAEPPVLGWQQADSTCVLFGLS